MTEIVVPLAGGTFRRRRRKEDPSPDLHPARIARALALAHALQDRRAAGEFRDYADMAKALRFTRARASQIMGLLLLARDIQEEILLLERPAGRQSPTEQQLRHVVATPRWDEQRRRWRTEPGCKLQADSKNGRRFVPPTEARSLDGQH